MSEIDSKHYWLEVSDTAAECAKQAKEEERDLYDVVHEMVDGHQWIIYTAYHHQVLQWSTQDAAALFDDMGGPDMKQGWDHVVQQAAYLVFHADVMEAAQEAFDALTAGEEGAES